MAKNVNYEKTEGERLNDELTFSRKSVWETADAKERKTMIDFSKEYIDFLNNHQAPPSMGFSRQGYWSG